MLKRFLKSMYSKFLGLSKPLLIYGDRLSQKRQMFCFFLGLSNILYVVQYIRKTAYFDHPVVKTSTGSIHITGNDWSKGSWGFVLLIVWCSRSISGKSCSFSHSKPESWKRWPVSFKGCRETYKKKPKWTSPIFFYFVIFYYIFPFYALHCIPLKCRNVFS